MKRKLVRWMSGSVVSACLAFGTDAAADLVLFTSDTLIGEDDLSYEGSNIVAQGCVVTVQGAHAFGAVTARQAAVIDSASTNLGCRSLLISESTVYLAGGSLLAVSNDLTVVSNSLLICRGTNAAAQVGGVWAGRGVTVSAEKVTVDSTSEVSADGQGYAGVSGYGAQGLGPGGSPSTSGGSHGGQGGLGAWQWGLGVSYGSAFDPVELGSSGGSYYDDRSGAGGGAVRLTVADTLWLDGRIGANGAAPQGYAGGGSGGSLWIEAGTVVGAGVVEACGANGNPGTGGGGGGGRVIVYGGDLSGFEGAAACSTAGGSGWNGYVGQKGSLLFVDTSVPDHRLHVYDNLFLSDPTNSFNAVTVHGGAVLTLAGGAVLKAGTSITVCSNALILCRSTNHVGQVEGLWMGRGVAIFSSNLTVEATGQIHADGQGYAGVFGYGAQGLGPGGAPTLSGGSHGGTGGQGSWLSGVGATYGSSLEPVDLGSSGGAHYSDWSGAGGGAIRVVLSGTLSLDGRIGANGAAPQVHSGAGAGGSLWITARELVGGGLFEARGADGNPGYAGGGGGGGRIVVYAQDAASFSGFSASTAAGGNGWSGAAGAGSWVFADLSASPMNVEVRQNAGLAGSGATFGRLFVHNGATLRLPSGFDLHAAQLRVDTNAAVYAGGGSALDVDETLWVASNATIVCQSVDNAATNASGQWVGRGPTIGASNLVVEAGGAISADAQGYVSQQASYANGVGPGFGEGGGVHAGAGGSHGGRGGNGDAGSYYKSGPTYGSSLTPTALGSSGGTHWGGPSGAGGGAVRLTVPGTLVLNGLVTANGGAGTGHAGGGAGGSLWVTAGTLAGGGRLEAKGGAYQPGYASGGGGGGRIAVYSGDASGFTGFASTTATGGIGAEHNGETGTGMMVDTGAEPHRLAVYQLGDIQETAAAYGAVTLHNGATLTTPTNLTLTTAALQVSTGATLRVGGGAAVTVTGLLWVADSGTLLCQSLDNGATNAAGQWVGRGVTLTASNVTVEANGRISADAQGYASQAVDAQNGIGPGYGQGGPVHGAAGGSHGGKGGAGDAGSYYTSLPVYGSALMPEALGSSGGTHWYGPSGAGGGAIRLTVGGTLTLDGLITANGGNAYGHAGGGAGGSLWVTAATLAGGGHFEADGGDRYPGYAGGGGGGGRIAVYYGAGAAFSGFAAGSADGGSGAEHNGGIGSELYINTSGVYGSLDVFSVAELAGTSGVYDAINIYSGSLALGPGFVLKVGALNVDTGAVMTVGGGSTLLVGDTLRVANGATLLCRGLNTTGRVDGAWAGQGVTIHAEEAVVEAGGVISADAQGYQGGAGAGLPGAGPGGGLYGGDTWRSAGGGHGGPGGLSANGGIPGALNGSQTRPTELGSGGSADSDASNLGGAGGGAIRLMIGESLLNNGVISANGGSGFSGDRGGGGSGGSVWVSAPDLAGEGWYKANGGNQLHGYAAGGSGGRLAFHVASLSVALNVQSVGGTSYGGSVGDVRGSGGGSVVVVYTNALLAAQTNLIVTGGSGGSPGAVIIRKDSDSDDLSDPSETGFWHTDTALADTDGDGVPDAREAARSTDPTNAAVFGTTIAGRVHYSGTQTGAVWVTARDVTFTNRALRTSGTGYVNLGDRDSLRITNAITMSAWVNLSDATGDQPILVKEGSGKCSYWFGVYNYRFGLLIGTGGGWGLWARSSGRVTPGEWTHLASTWDGTNWCSYMNGELVASGTYTGELLPSTAPVQIGQNSEWASTHFNGMIDEVSVWSRALTADEIQAGLFRKLAGNEDRLAGYWNFDNGAATDLTANANDGMLVNDAAVLTNDLWGMGAYRAWLPTVASDYVIEEVRTPAHYAVACFRDFNLNGVQEFWESQAAYSNNPVSVTGAVAGIDMTLPVVAPPAADAGGPYSVDEFTGDAIAGTWAVQLNGSNSSDTVSGSTLLSYEWTLGVETFDGGTLDPTKWITSASGVAQNSQLEVTGVWGWGNWYCFSKGVLFRGDAVTFEARVKFCRYAMVGLLRSTGAYQYGNMPYAFHSSDGWLYIYEDGSQRVRPRTIDESRWYRVRIVLKAAQGARYYIREDGATEWTLLYDSSYGSETRFRRGADVHTGTLCLDDLADRACIASPVYRFSGPGVFPVTLVVTDPTGLSDTNGTTVTTLVNAPPAAHIAPEAQTQYESDAVEGVWTFPFSAAASADDHGLYSYEWDWDYDGVFTPTETTGALATHTWTNAGAYTVALRVTDHALQTNLATATVNVVTGAAPVAITGGPYVFDEFTGRASTGAWNVVVSGTNSFDNESSVIHYLWDFGTDTFDGTNLCVQKWVNSPEGVSQSNAVTLVNTAYTWGQRYLYSRDVYARGYGMAFEARIQPVSSVWAMIGFMNTGARYHYDQMPYALYFCNGVMQIYEDNSYRGQFTSYTPGEWYQIRIELKPVQGARYYMKPDGASEWTLLYDSNYGSATSFRRGIDVHYGTVTVDDMREIVAGATPAYRLYQPGVYQTSLIVWDQVLNTASATTTVTLVKNAPPVANMGGDKLGSETNCVGGLWTFLFSAALSTDDHELYMYEWDWDYNAGVGFRPSGETGISARHTFSAAQIGSNPVALRVTDHVMQTHVHVAHVILSPGAAPVADAGGPYTVEVGTWARLDGTGSSDDYEVARYEWDFGDGGTGSGTRPQHRYNDLGDYTVSLVVYDNLDQASAAATATVHVVEAQAPTADAGGPYEGGAGGPPVYFNASLSHDASGNAEGIAKYVWDADVAVDSDGNGTPDDDMDRVGIRPFHTYGAAGVYTAKLTVVSGAYLSNSAAVAVSVVPNLAPNVICVPYHGNTNEFHPTFAGATATLKGVVRDSGPLQYSWDFGDGSTTSVQSVGSAYAIEAQHAYSGGEGKSFVARLTVWDGAGLAGSDTYAIMILASNLETRAQMSVDNGLWWLHKVQSKGNGSWSGSIAASTASALQAFEINGHRVDGFGDEDPYVETVDNGFRYLFGTLRANAVGVEYAPPAPSAVLSAAIPTALADASYSLGQESARTGVWPAYVAPVAASGAALSSAAEFVLAPSLLDVAASNGIAIDVNCSYPPYELGMVMDALAASQARTFIAATGGANIKGRSFYDLLQDMVDMYAWGQGQPGSGGRGGWRYGWRYGSADNSVSQWGAIGILAAEDNFGIICPDYVKQENKIWLNSSWNGNGFGYDGTGHPWGTTVNTTPSALVQLAMDDVSTTNDLWSHTEDVIAAGWTSAGSYGDKASRNYYGRYALTKALRLARPAKIEVLRNGLNWYADEAVGVRRVLTDQQYASGNWDGDYYGGGLGADLSTAWAIVMLTPSLFTQPPEAIITAPAVWGYGLPLTLTAERSFSVDPKKSIAKYMWDFDNDGNFDLITTDPTDPAAAWTWPDPHPAVTGDVPVTVTVRLKVIDSDDPPQSDETFKTIVIAEPPHAPYAHVDVPASASAGVLVRLSGTGSFDIDPTDFITEYQWDFNNDDHPDLVTNAASFYIRFSQPGIQTVALRVVDNGVMNNDVKMTSEWDYATCTVGENQAPVADAGGPYTVYEGVPVTLAATNSVDPNGDALFYAWDFDGDGSTDSTNAVVERTWTLPGSNTVWLTVSDTSLSNSTSVSFWVHAVNHAPSFTKGSGQNVDEDSGPHTVVGWASGISAGPAHEAWQTVAFFVTNSLPALFSAAPSVTTNGTLTFTSAPNANGVATVSLYLQDSGGTAYGGQDSSPTQTFQIAVNAVNDAPVLTPANPALTPITEDAVNNAGTTVAALVGTSISDVDAGAVQGLAIFTSANGNGAWQYSTNAGTSWAAVGSVATNAALLLRSLDRVRFLPNALNGTTASFGYFAWDQTSGSVATKQNATSRGGTTAYSGVSDTASIMVSAVNDAPVLTVPTNRVMNELTLLSVTNTATDVDLPADTLRFQLLSGPGGMVLDTNTGAVAWTPAEAQGPSTNVVTVRVYDNGAPVKAATNSFTVWVGEVNLAPTLTVPTNTTVNELTLLSVTNAASDADLPANALRYQLLQAPTGMLLDTNTGAIAWTPTEAQGPSTNVVTVRVYDNGAPVKAATNSFTVWVGEVNLAPTLTVPTNTTVSELTLLTVTNTAADADLPANALRYQLLQAPSGMALDTNTGVIAWTPTEAQGPGTNVVTVRVYDNGAPSKAATNSFTVWVGEVNLAPVLPTQTNRTVKALSLLAVTNSATDVDVPANTLAYQLLTAPVGAVISNGVITWTPTVQQGATTNLFVTRVADNGTPTLAATNSFEVIVLSANTRPRLDLIPDVTLVIGETLDFRVPAHDSDWPSNILNYALDTYYLYDPPVYEAGLDSHTGRFVWTAAAADAGNVFWFAVTVTDDGVPPLSTTRIFQATVEGYPPALRITLVDGALQLRWDGVSSRWYQIQYKNSLLDPEWLDLGGPVQAAGGVLTLEDAGASTRPSRFYRAVLLPEL